MIQYLQRLKKRRGFTLLELIIVIAIIAIMAAVILPGLSTEHEVINSANSAARDFYAAVQMSMTKFSTYDGQMSPAYSNNNNLGVMRYYPLMGGNYPFDETYTKGTKDSEYPARASLYIMVHSNGGTIRDVAVVTRARENSTEGIYRLLQRETSDRNTEFGRLLKGEIQNRIEYKDGYYYARVDFEYPTTFAGTPSDDIKKFTVKPVYTVYCAKELPQATGSYETFRNSLTFGARNKLNWNGTICGTCAPLDSTGKSIGDTGTELT